VGEGEGEESEMNEGLSVDDSRFCAARVVLFVSTGWNFQDIPLDREVEFRQVNADGDDVRSRNLQQTP
jgi:hypothetical protein